jgi:hypothetical protein
MMRDLLRRGDVMSVIDDYRRELERSLRDHPRDLAIHHRLGALKDLENRIKLLSRGGLRVIDCTNIDEQ